MDAKCGLWIRDDNVESTICSGDRSDKQIHPHILGYLWIIRDDGSIVSSRAVAYELGLASLIYPGITLK